MTIGTHVDVSMCPFIGSDCGKDNQLGFNQNNTLYPPGIKISSEDKMIPQHTELHVPLSQIVGHPLALPFGSVHPTA